jgi:cell division protease FtsH
LTIGPENITGTLKSQESKPDQRFTTIRVNDPSLVKDLDKSGVDYSGRYESNFLSSVLSWVVPIGIFF